MKRARVAINITVPWELRQRMRDRPDIKWSRIAEKAFEQAIETIVKRDVIKL